ncbi:leucine-rich repeat-containing protein 14 [Megalops cyprinoides]|uniref:leucine-rich repeat-containing protein 14 n=1 Tax=Megalops cyprinoides TaxID=118141 RepID=UPI0018650AB5|nr:leucine-rich repeat-containing protein 14 [Megalops cyprinoides]
MVPSLVRLCAKEVVSDHSSSPCWLGCVPRELYQPLLEAAFAHCRPLAIGELVQRWPERTLRLGGRRRPGQSPPNRLCVQALLLAVVRGLGDKRCALQVLDLCGLQCEEGGAVDSMGGWSLTVALCSMVLQAKGAAQGGPRRERERERKRVLEAEREKDGVVKRERGLGAGGARGQELDKERALGVRRRMERERVRGSGGGDGGDPEEDGVVVRVRADLFVNARSWERVRTALSAPGPLRLHCRYLRVEEIPALSIAVLLALLRPAGLLGMDIRYSSLGVSGLALLLPALAPFPALSSLRLHYCNLDMRWDQSGQEEALRDVAKGLSKLERLQRLSLTALRLPGHLRMLLSGLSQPLEVLELPYLSLSPADLSYLSCSPHASSLRRLDLSENKLDEAALPSLRRLLHQAAGSLSHLSLSGCGLSDGLLGALLPSLGCCRALRTLALALNPLSQAGVLSLVRVAAGIPSLRLLLYPNPLEEYQPGLPPLPSSAQLLDWPLDEVLERRDAMELEMAKVLAENGRSDLLLTSDLLSYNGDLIEEQ